MILHLGRQSGEDFNRPNHKQWDSSFEHRPTEAQARENPKPMEDVHQGNENGHLNFGYASAGQSPGQETDKNLW